MCCAVCAVEETSYCAFCASYLGVFCAVQVEETSYECILYRALELCCSCVLCIAVCAVEETSYGARLVEITQPQ